MSYFNPNTNENNLINDGNALAPNFTALGITDTNTPITTPTPNVPTTNNFIMPLNAPQETSLIIPSQYVLPAPCLRTPTQIKS